MHTACSDGLCLSCFARSHPLLLLLPLLLQENRNIVLGRVPDQEAYTYGAHAPSQPFNCAVTQHRGKQRNKEIHQSVAGSHMVHTAGGIEPVVEADHNGVRGAWPVGV